MKKIKKLWIYLLLFLIFTPFFLYVIAGYYLTDRVTNGFAGINAIIEMKIQKKGWIKLTDKPIQYLTPNSNFKSFMKDYSEEYNHFADHVGEAIVKGEKYLYSTRAFTEKYSIITFGKVND